MNLQKVLATIIILLFVIQLFKQKNKKHINGAEFYLWLFFWIMAEAIIIFLPQLDALVKALGFSGEGIQVLLYLAVAILFYLIFNLRLKLWQMDRNLTKITEHLALKK